MDEPNPKPPPDDPAAAAFVGITCGIIALAVLGGILAISYRVSEALKGL